MSLIKMHKNRITLKNIQYIFRSYNSKVQLNSDEYNEKAIYPQILDLSKEGRMARQHEREAEDLRKIETVEEKLIKINMAKYYGWKCFILNGHATPLGCLPLIQHFTRTHLIKSSTLPESYLPYDSAASYMAKQIQSDIEECIVSQYQHVRRQCDLSKNLEETEKMKSKFLIESINRVITNHLAPNIPHIMDSQMDIEPVHESFWFSGGFTQHNYTLKKIEKGVKPVDTDHPIQYIGNPVLTLRSALPLEPLIPYSDASNESLHVPQYKFDPRTLDFYPSYRHGTNIPGFWPGDDQEFGILSYHTKEGMSKIPDSYPADYTDKSLDAQGILNSFGWLMAQACYQGFSTYNDVTYPLVTQTVITNGQYWSLFAYQMNTVFSHHDHYKNNKLRNICYSVGPLKLFDGIDNNGKLIGFNEDIIKMLLQFYINVPSERTDTEMKPYLGKDVKHVADIHDIEKRNWLEKAYKHLASNRPRHRLPEEMYHWEWIYKIKFKSRWGDNTRTYFEYPGVKSPYKRRLDEHAGEYVPKSLRKEGFKSIVKWKKTFYP